MIPQYISIKEDEELSKEEKEKRRREKKEEEERLAAEKLLQEKLERQEKEEEEKEEDIFNFNIDTATSINESNEDAAKKDFFMKEFHAIIERHENSKIWGARMISPGPNAIR